MSVRIVMVVVCIFYWFLVFSMIADSMLVFCECPFKYIYVLHIN